QWDGDAKRLGGLEVDDQFDFGGLLDGKISRFFALQNSAGVDAGQAVSVGSLAAIAHQTASSGELAVLVDRRHRVTEGERGELPAPGGEKRLGTDDEPTRAQLHQACEDLLEVAFAARVQHLEVEAERPRRRLRGAGNGLGHRGIGWIDEKPNDPRRGYELPE